MDNLAPARLFPKQAFTGVPDTMTPPTPELFFLPVFFLRKAGFYLLVPFNHPGKLFKGGDS